MMKSCTLLSAVVGLLVVSAVVAQEREREREGGRAGRTPPVEVHHHYYGPSSGGPGYGYGYGTGYGYDQRGLSGGLASGIGQARLSTSEAAENYAQTAHQVQENHNYAVNSYYANKEVHDAYVAAHRDKRPTPEELSKMAKTAEPGRLSSAQFNRSTNVINWPALLRDPEFTSERQTLDHLFDERTPANSGAESDGYVQIQQACAAMKETLVEKLRQDNLPGVTFCATEHFIKSLAYEASFSVQ